MKFVNDTIPAQESSAIFLKDSRECSRKITRDRPLISENCQVYGFNLSLKRVCLDENERRLDAHKKRTKNLYIQCLAQQGWREEPYKTSAENTTNTSISHPVIPRQRLSQTPPCLGCLNK